MIEINIQMDTLSIRIVWEPDMHLCTIIVIGKKSI